MTQLLRPASLSLLLGFVSGGRSVAGLAALASSASPDSDITSERLLGHAKVRALLSAGAAGELVADKLPFTPSRLGFPQILGRLVTGALCGVVIAQRLGASTTQCAVLGAVSAYAGSLAGARWRQWAADHFDANITGALIEDAIVATGGALAARTSKNQ